MIIPKFRENTTARFLIQNLFAWILVLAMTLVIGEVFINDWIGNWTDAGPTYFLSQDMNPAVERILPSLLQPVSDDTLWWLFLRFPADPHDYGAIGLLTGVIGPCCLTLRYISRNNVSRTIVKILLLSLGLRYFSWRTFATINNQTHPISTFISYTVWFIEFISFASFVLYTLQTMITKTKERREQANTFSETIKNRDYLPAVDVFIPTYNEPKYIVQRTIVGCQSMDYDNKRIYVLDDYPPNKVKHEDLNGSGSSDENAFSREDICRPEIYELTQELGCEYIGHPNNQDRKAGNLNNALKKTGGDLIVVMDADFVPFSNFLTRTVGFFNRPEIYMVQTPQDFYNPDYHARNLGLDHFLPNDMEHFYGLLQPNRDAFNSVICCGSSYVVRRSNLERIGYYYTGCCVEDFQTSLKLLTEQENKERAIYLNEPLSRGESPRSFSAFISQRLRWLQGNVHVYFRPDLKIWSLDCMQKSFMISLALYCIQPVIRVVLLMVPLISIYSGIAPILAPLDEACYYFLPFWLLLVASYGWAADYRSNYFWNECYETIFCFPALGRLIAMAGKFTREGEKGLSADFGKTVTDKGKTESSNGSSLRLVFPLILLLAATGMIMLLRYIGLYQGWWPRLNDHTIPLLFWLGYNSLIMLVAILSAFDQEEHRESDRFPLQTPCTITINSNLGSSETVRSETVRSGTASPNANSLSPNDSSSNNFYLNNSNPNNQQFTSYVGHTSDVSEGGALLSLGEAVKLQAGTWITLDLPQEGFSTEAVVHRQTSHSSPTELAVRFDSLATNEYRHLVKILYGSGSNSWKRRKQPGLIDSVLALFAAILGFRLPPIYLASEED
jgi:cellulose synthase (UDP-forming)